MDRTGSQGPMACFCDYINGLTNKNDNCSKVRVHTMESDIKLIWNVSTKHPFSKASHPKISWESMLPNHYAVNIISKIYPKYGLM